MYPASQPANQPTSQPANQPTSKKAEQRSGFTQLTPTVVSQTFYLRLCCQAAARPLQQITAMPITVVMVGV
jgi:hypothetical protein